jgi:hypothetical protein
VGAVASAADNEILKSAGTAKFPDGESEPREEAVKRLDGEIVRLDEMLEAFDGALAAAGDVLSKRQSQHPKLRDRFERATGERDATEGSWIRRIASFIHARSFHQASR